MSELRYGAGHYFRELVQVRILVESGLYGEDVFLPDHPVVLNQQGIVILGDPATMRVLAREKILNG